MNDQHNIVSVITLHEFLTLSEYCGSDKDTLKGKLFAENNFRLRAVPKAWSWVAEDRFNAFNQARTLQKQQPKNHFQATGLNMRCQLILSAENGQFEHH